MKQVWYVYNFKDGTEIWRAGKFNRAELKLEIKEHGDMIGTWKKVVINV